MLTNAPINNGSSVFNAIVSLGESPTSAVYKAAQKSLLELNIDATFTGSTSQEFKNAVANTLEPKAIQALARNLASTVLLSERTLTDYSQMRAEGIILVLQMSFASFNIQGSPKLTDVFVKSTKECFRELIEHNNELGLDNLNTTPEIFFDNVNSRYGNFKEASEKYSQLLCNALVRSKQTNESTSGTISEIMSVLSETSSFGSESLIGAEAVRGALVDYSNMASEQLFGIAISGFLQALSIDFDTTTGAPLPRVTTPLAELTAPYPRHVLIHATNLSAHVGLTVQHFFSMESYIDLLNDDDRRRLNEVATGLAGAIERTLHRKLSTKVGDADLIRDALRFSSVRTESFRSLLRKHPGNASLLQGIQQGAQFEADLAGLVDLCRRGKDNQGTEETATGDEVNV